MAAIYRVRENSQGEWCIDLGDMHFARDREMGRAATKGDAERIVEALNARVPLTARVDEDGGVCLAPATTVRPGADVATAHDVLVQQVKSWRGKIIAHLESGNRDFALLLRMVETYSDLLHGADVVSGQTPSSPRPRVMNAR